MRKLTALFYCCCLLLIWCCHNESQQEEEVVETYGITNEQILSKVENGIHIPSGLVAGKGLESMLVFCISCHSSKLITQNRATADGWKSMIDWMYETQNLPQLGEHESIIIDYLAEHYAPTEVGRRQQLEVEEWYELE